MKSIKVFIAAVIAAKVLFAGTPGQTTLADIKEALHLAIIQQQSIQTEMDRRFGLLDQNLSSDKVSTSTEFGKFIEWKKDADDALQTVNSRIAAIENNISAIVKSLDGQKNGTVIDGYDCSDSKVIQEYIGKK